MDFESNCRHGVCFLHLIYFWFYVDLSVVFLFCFVFVFIFFIFIYLFLAVLGPWCCAQAFSSCGEGGLLFVAVRRLLIAVTSLVAEHGL